MKRFQFSVFAMMIMALVCVGFASCGGDGDDESIVGVWTGSPLTITGNGSGEITCEFTSGGIIKWNNASGSTENGTYTFSGSRSAVDKSINGTVSVSWNSGKTESMSVLGMTAISMGITRGSTMYMLYRKGTGGNSGNTSDVTAIVGTWYGDHSVSYFSDWTFNSDGTGERHIQDGDVGSWYRFKYVITNYNSTTRSGHLTITYTSGAWSGETDERDFKISESGRAIEIGTGYYTK